MSRPSIQAIGAVRRVVVRVPVPAGLRQEVAAAHRHRVAADHRPHALALEDEAEGVLRVPVLGRVLPRHQVLDRRPQRRGGERPAAQGPGWRARSRAAHRRGPPGRARPPARPARAGCPSASGAAPPSTAGAAASGRRSPSTAGQAAPSRSRGRGPRAPASRRAGSPPPPPSGAQAIRSQARSSCVQRGPSPAMANKRFCHPERRRLTPVVRTALPRRAQALRACCCYLQLPPHRSYPGIIGVVDGRFPRFEARFRVSAHDDWCGRPGGEPSRRRGGGRRRQAVLRRAGGAGGARARRSAVSHAIAAAARGLDGQPHASRAATRRTGSVTTSSRAAKR